jgi:hypothetical protein
MEASQHSLLAACFTLHSINATLAIVPQRGAGLWITWHGTRYCTSYPYEYQVRPAERVEILEAKSGNMNSRFAVVVLIS